MVLAYLVKKNRPKYSNQKGHRMKEKKIINCVGKKTKCVSISNSQC